MVFQVPLKPLDNDCSPGWTQAGENGKNKLVKQYKMKIIAHRTQSFRNQNWKYGQFGLNANFRGVFIIFFQGPSQFSGYFRDFFRGINHFRGFWGGFQGFQGSLATLLDQHKLLLTYTYTVVHFQDVGSTTLFYWYCFGKWLAEKLNLSL